MQAERSIVDICKSLESFETTVTRANCSHDCKVPLHLTDYARRLRTIRSPLRSFSLSTLDYLVRGDGQHRVIPGGFSVALCSRDRLNAYFTPQRRPALRQLCRINRRYKCVMIPLLRRE